MAADRQKAQFPVMKPPFQPVPEIHFADGFDPALLQSGWAIGGYNIKRKGMYTAPQYESVRNVHMGIDIWAPAGEPVLAPLKGRVIYTANHDQEGNYGGTVVLVHEFEEKPVYALYGHLSLSSLVQSSPGKVVDAGSVVGWLGVPGENGNWHPHLHYQLSWEDPGEADMPGVVSDEFRERAISIYPDPEKVIGQLI